MVKLKKNIEAEATKKTQKCSSCGFEFKDYKGLIFYGLN
jgi:hypothetical protein